MLLVEGAPFPVIQEVYDPLSRRRNGTITPQAPIIITGCNLEMLTWENTRLCIIPAVNDKILIELNNVHRCSEDKVCAIIPQVDEGEYFLALKILMKDKECFIYIFSEPLIVSLKRYGRVDMYPHYYDGDK